MKIVLKLIHCLFFTPWGVLILRRLIIYIGIAMSFYYVGLFHVKSEVAAAIAIMFGVICTMISLQYSILKRLEYGFGKKE